MLIRKALTIDGEDKVVNHLLQNILTNTSWSKLQKKYSLTKGRIYTALKGKRRPGGLQQCCCKKIRYYVFQKPNPVYTLQHGITYVIRMFM